MNTFLYFTNISFATSLIAGMWAWSERSPIASFLKKKKIKDADAVSFVAAYVLGLLPALWFGSHQTLSILFDRPSLHASGLALSLGLLVWGASYFKEERTKIIFTAGISLLFVMFGSRFSVMMMPQVVTIVLSCAWHFLLIRGYSLLSQVPHVASISAGLMSLFLFSAAVVIDANGIALNISSLLGALLALSWVFMNAKKAYISPSGISFIGGLISVTSLCIDWHDAGQSMYVIPLMLGSFHILCASTFFFTKQKSWAWFLCDKRIMKKTSYILSLSAFFAALFVLLLCAFIGAVSLLTASLGYAFCMAAFIFSMYRQRSVSKKRA